ncbi:MAG: rhomboid family intramembrane serine protease [Planctomycetota bacterium]|nr:rhomboid family intramembrane serine protease [Planctomycetota bacterium]
MNQEARPEEGQRPPAPGPERASSPPPLSQENTPVSLFWVVLSVCSYIGVAIISGQHILADGGAIFPSGSGPVGEAVRRSLEANNPIVLPIAAFGHRGFVHIFVGCVALFSMAGMVERVRGSAFTFTVLVWTSTVGAGVGWLFVGEPTIGSSTGFFGAMGALVALILRRTVPRYLVWFSSFPLLMLAGFFVYSADQAAYLSHEGHAAAATLGLVLGMVRKGTPKTRRVNLFLLVAWLVGGAAFVIGGWILQTDWRPRWGDFRLASLIESDRFVRYEDSQERFSLSHPASLGPLLDENGPDIITFGSQGDEDQYAFRIVIQPRSPLEDLDTFTRNSLFAWQVKEEVNQGDFEVTEREKLMVGVADARRITALYRQGGREWTMIWVFAFTDKRQYRIFTRFDKLYASDQEGRTRMIDSVEISE